MPVDTTTSKKYTETTWIREFLKEFFTGRRYIRVANPNF